MNPARKAIEAEILSFMNDIDKSGQNQKIWKDLLATWSDKEFEDFMKKILEGESILTVFAPHFNNKGFSKDNCLAAADKHDIPLFERLRIVDSEVPEYTTPNEYLILELPVRVQSQNLVKKISVPKNNKVIDYTTYQPTGASKGSTMSQPELNALDGFKMHKTIEELFRFRGGDIGGFRAYNAMASQVGSISLDKLYPHTTEVESTKAVKSYFLGMHLVLED